MCWQRQGNPAKGGEGDGAEARSSPSKEGAWLGPRQGGGLWSRPREGGELGLKPIEGAGELV